MDCSEPDSAGSTEGRLGEAGTLGRRADKAQLRACARRREASPSSPAVRERLVGCVAGAVLLGALPGPSAAAGDAHSVRITEWVVPWPHSRPRHTYVDDAHRVWFVGAGSDYVAYLDPFSGKFKRFALEPGTGPHSLVVDAEGGIWYAGSEAAHIGKLVLEQEMLLKFPMPKPDASDPHSLALGHDGDIWFTVERGNFVGRLEAETGRIRLIEVPTPGARPHDIAIDSKDRPWIAEYGTNKLAVVDPESMRIREFPLPRAAARPRRLCVTSGDEIWYADYARGNIGRLNPATGAVDEWPVPGGRDARPDAIASDGRDRIWFVETGLRPNRFVGFDPETGEFFSVTGIGSGAGAVHSLHYYAPAGEIWFGTDANTIGRAEVQ